MLAAALLAPASWSVSSVGEWASAQRARRATEFRPTANAPPRPLRVELQQRVRGIKIEGLEAMFKAPLRRIPEDDPAYVPGLGLFMTPTGEGLNWLPTDDVAAALAERRRLEADRQAAEELTEAALSNAAAAAVRSRWVERAVSAEAALAPLLRDAPVDAATLRQHVEEARAAAVTQRAPQLMRSATGLLELLERAEECAHAADANEATWHVLFRYEPSFLRELLPAPSMAEKETVDVAGLGTAVRAFMGQ